jgi:hypothetical protein
MSNFENKTRSSRIKRNVLRQVLGFATSSSFISQKPQEFYLTEPSFFKLYFKGSA